MDRRIDLNGDVGEGLDDAPFIPLLTSVNIACGGHAGDDASIERTIRLAVAAGAAIGAHPGYPDREGFGRRDLDLVPEELDATIREQVGRVVDAARRLGAAVSHVKAHGALYNSAARDPLSASIVARAVAAVSGELALVGPPGSALLTAARAAGLRAVAEGFADRAYEADGTLRSRRLPGAVLADPAAVAVQAVRIARDRIAEAVDGTILQLPVDTLCLHGDTPGAVANARAVRLALDEAGISVGPVAG